ncbi:MAG: hypothetical protein ONB24_11720, partial [candidate division KSB1 bacterium]|nr:hypothetical protein [candidate division KSB1 bacterium]
IFINCQAEIIQYGIILNIIRVVIEWNAFGANYVGDEGSEEFVSIKKLRGMYHLGAFLLTDQDHLA